VNLRQATRSAASYRGAPRTNVHLSMQLSFLRTAFPQTSVQDPNSVRMASGQHLIIDLMPSGGWRLPHTAGAVIRLPRGNGRHTPVRFHSPLVDWSRILPAGGVAATAAPLPTRAGDRRHGGCEGQRSPRGFQCLPPHAQRLAFGMAQFRLRRSQLPKANPWPVDPRSAHRVSAMRCCRMLPCRSVRTQAC
jgi:hypothetical protein